MRNILIRVLFEVISAMALNGVGFSKTSISHSGYVFGLASAEHAIKMIRFVRAWNVAVDPAHESQLFPSIWKLK